MSDDASGFTNPTETISMETTPVATVSAVKEVPEDAWTVAVATWINNHVRNSPIAGSVEAWNHLGGVLPELKRLLNDELRKL